MQRVRVETAAFDQGAELNRFSQDLDRVGAVVSFTGVVRDFAQGGLVAMEIEHYPGMTQSAIEAIRAEACTRWDLADALVIHRYGRLEPSAPIMMVATAAAHRVAAFEAAEFLMDYLKSRAPFWKKEITAEGEAWVEATIEDEAALGRWDGQEA
ncbi:MAG: molybdenum cofactor biosynthesis protein MoaE [Mangrovicoccus sp.]